MALLEKQEVRDLLIAARATRNYCMLTGRDRENSDMLIDALAPFDGNPNQIKSTHLVNLRKAMRDACDDIDDYTLTRILEGDPPVRIGPIRALKPKQDQNGQEEARRSRFQMFRAWFNRYWPSIWQRALLPGLAVVFLILAMHYTHWTFKANLLLKRLDDHITTDIYEEIRDLIVVARAVDTSATNLDPPTSGTPSQKLFNETMSELKDYHYQEKGLRDDSLRAVERFNALIAFRQFIQAIPALLSPPQDSELIDQILGTRLPNNDPTQTTFSSTTENLDPPSVAEIIDQVDELIEEVNEVEADTTEEIEGIKRATDNEDNTIPAATESIRLKPDRIELMRAAIAMDEGFQEIVKIISQRTFRHPLITEDHVAARLGLLRTARDLTDRISLANRFALPMIYGSLGAALFCLVRVLTPALSDLGPARAFLRILFGAFAAMTLSMLFIPANVFTINDQSNPTLIFLACFLFGYSFDAVLSALHRLEAFLQGRLLTKDVN